MTSTEVCQIKSFVLVFSSPGWVMMGEISRGETALPTAAQKYAMKGENQNRSIAKAKSADARRTRQRIEGLDGGR